MKTKSNFSKKFVYSIGNIGGSIAYMTFTTYLIFFYVDVMGLPPTLAGSAMIVFTIWNMLNDPLAGYISDRTRTKWGRRKPYILFGSIPLFITFMLLWSPSNSFLETTSKLFAYFLTIICLYDTFFSVVELNYTAVYPEMYPDLKDRSEVTAYMQIMYMVGSMIGTALPPLIYGRLGWRYMGLILGGLIILFKMISLIGIKEEKVFAQDIQPSLWKSLSLTLTNRSFLPAVITNLLAIYAVGMITAIAPFYTKYVLNFGESETSLFLAIMTLTSIPFMVVWSKFIVVKLGPKKSFIASLIILGLLVLSALVLKPEAAIIIAILIGIGLSGVALLPYVVIADVIDEDEVNNGVRREGMYFGINGFMIRFSGIIQGGTIGYLLPIFGYIETSTYQPASAIWGFKVMISIIPMLALLIGAFIIWKFYPLYGEKLNAVKETLADLHKKKKEQLIKGEPQS